MDVPRFPPSQHGLSLLESLVSLLVLSIGMLGIGSMLLASMKDARGSMNRSKAIALAWDMAERMRANGAGAATYASGWTDTGASSDCFESDTVPPGSAASCDPAALAAHDVFHWKSALASTVTGIPSGEGQVTITPGAALVPTTVQIDIRWQEGFNADGTPAQQLLTVTTMPWNF